MILCRDCEKIVRRCPENHVIRTIGVTRQQTVHGNPGERRMLPAGMLILVVPADNQPDDSEIKWWAHPLQHRTPLRFASMVPDSNRLPTDWPKTTAEWAESVGVGLSDADVEILA
jgi:hypothetical protein